MPTWFSDVTAMAWSKQQSTAAPMLEVQPLISIPCGASVQGQPLGSCGNALQIKQNHGPIHDIFSPCPEASWPRFPNFALIISQTCGALSMGWLSFFRMKEMKERSFRIWLWAVSTLCSSLAYCKSAWSLSATTWHLPFAYHNFALMFLIFPCPCAPIFIEVFQNTTAFPYPHQDPDASSNVKSWALSTHAAQLDASSGARGLKDS